MPTFYKFAPYNNIAHCGNQIINSIGVLELVPVIVDWKKHKCVAASPGKSVGCLEGGKGRCVALPVGTRERVVRGVGG